MNRLPEFIFDTNKRYKADTEKVLAWLCETAKKCGYTLDTTAAVQNPAGRLKGSARREARKRGDERREP